MSPDDQLQSVCSQKPAGLPHSEEVGATPTVIWLPLSEAGIGRVAPEQVTHAAFLWNFLKAIESLYFLYGLAMRRDASVDSKVFPVDNSAER